MLIIRKYIVIWYIEDFFLEQKNKGSGMESDNNSPIQ